MRDTRPLPFLARPGYRLRRLVEMIRLLPFLGLLIFLLPVLWVSGAIDGSVLSSSGWLYIFCGWFVLIFAAGLAARAYTRALSEADDGDEDS